MPPFQLQIPNRICCNKLCLNFWKYNLNLVKHLDVHDFVIETNNEYKSLRCMVTFPFKRKVKAVTLVVIELIAVVDNSGCSLPSGQTNLL